jgi:hypothetical protein
VVSQTLVVVHSDLSGAPDAQSAKLGLFGAEYELDLTVAEMAQLEALLQPYLTVARRVGGRRTRGAGTPAPTQRPGGAQAKTGTSSGAIREWARAHGFDVSDRGRIPQPVQDAYLAAQNGATQNGAAQAEAVKAPRTRAKKAAASQPDAAVAEAAPVRRRARKTASKS